MPEDGVNVTVTEYLVTIWPLDHNCGDAARWCLVVRERGTGRWAVEQSRDHGFPKVVLSRSGKWVLNSPRDPRCRFSLAEALDAARRHAATVTVTLTAEQAMNKHLATPCPAGAGTAASSGLARTKKQRRRDTQ